MAKSGERVMVLARRDFDPQTFDPKSKLIELVNNLTILAMVGIVDPPRNEAKDAIAKCHSAGIQVRMITGDHAVTPVPWPGTGTGSCPATTAASGS